MLLDSQRNRLFDLIRNADQDPRNYSMSVSEKMAGVIYQEPDQGDFYYFIDISADGYRVRYRPALDRPHDESGWGPWNEVVETTFPEWLSFVEREVSAPDLWGQLSAERELVDAASGPAENTPFAPEERAQISAQLEEIREFLFATEDVSAEQQRTIESRLRYLEEATGRLGRIDWVNIFVSTILQFAVNAVVSTGTVQDVLRMAAQGIGPLFGPEIPGLPG